MFPSGIVLSINPSQPSVEFHIETSHLFCRAKQMTCFYMKRNTGLKCRKKLEKCSRHQLVAVIVNFDVDFEQISIFSIKVDYEL